MPPPAVAAAGAVAAAASIPEDDDNDAALALYVARLLAALGIAVGEWGEGGGSKNKHFASNQYTHTEQIQGLDASKKPAKKEGGKP